MFRSLTGLPGHALERLGACSGELALTVKYSAVTGQPARSFRNLLKISVECHLIASK